MPRRKLPPMPRLLRWQLRLLPLILPALLGLVIFSIRLGFIGVTRAALAMGAGMFFGLILNRVQRIHYHGESERLVATVDTIGLLLLLCFVTLMSLRALFLVNMTESLTEAGAIGLATSQGVMLMRLGGLQRAIRRALRGMWEP